MPAWLPDFASWPEQPGYLRGIFVMGLFAALYPLVLSKRRRLNYTLGLLGYASFYVMGLRMAWVLGPAVALGSLIPLRMQYLPQFPLLFRFRRLSFEEMKGRSGDLIVEGLVFLFAMVVTDVLYRRYGDGIYPIPVWHWRDMAQFVVVAGILTCTWFFLNEARYRLTGVDFIIDAPSEDMSASGPEMLLFTNLAVYGLIGLIAAPVQLAVHYVYVTTGWEVALLSYLWAFYMNTVFTLWIDRRERLREALEQIQQSERLAAIGEVTARIVHQMRHELGLMAASTYLINERMGSIPGEERETIEGELTKLNAVREQLRRILVEDLPAEGETEHKENNEAKPGLRELLSMQVEALQAKAKQAGVELNIEGGDPSYTPEHPRTLGEALFNVVENAVAAAKSSVDVSLAREKGAAWVRVVDDGPGIPEESLHKVTQPFFTTKAEGTGMGLAIAISAARREGGEVLIANRKDGGLEVKFRFPVTGRADD
ncbi:MAG: HAMP domain-containing histidine kinase [Chrysiogenetes bacterium]|nr:HAMP domain-containing histidine kinase [Chrysiogenetes bacterium]